MMVDRLVSLLSDTWRPVFSQRRSLQRAVEQAVATPCAMGRRTITRTICALGRHQQDWSADYKLFSRSPWDEDALFGRVIPAYLERFAEGFIPIGFDDTKTPKSGLRVESAFWQRDPMSPPFHTNLIRGLRFLQASVLFPLYLEGDHDARGVPVRFREAPAVKKPGKRATDEQREAYKAAKKAANLSTYSVAMMRGLRNEIDRAGAVDRVMLSVLDGSFCNRTVFRSDLDRVELLARCRKDAKLCWPAEPGGRRKYGTEKFTPEQVRQDKAVRWRTARVRYGGGWRKMRYKQFRGVLWQRGAGLRRLRLFVVAPQPYKNSIHAKTNYRQPAYLLCTDLKRSAGALIQAYFDRWQIEVNHREEKSTLGVGQAQVWAKRSVPRQPTFAVASYAMMLLAALDVFGPGRTSHFVPLPKWRRNAKRPSALDLVTLLRKEISETHLSDVVGRAFSENLRNYAYT